MERVVIYTDGACCGNPGKGGYAAIIQGHHEAQVTGSEPDTTNNRMELMAAIAGLEALPMSGLSVTVYSDSKYVVNGIMSWIVRWKRVGWRKRGGGHVLNRDLWERLDAARSLHQVTFEWVRGHNGHVFNERCDALANAASQR